MGDEDGPGSPVGQADVATWVEATLAIRGRSVTDLHEGGLPRREPGGAPGAAAAQARLMASFPSEDPRFLTDEQVQAVLDAGPALAEAAGRLSTGPVPLGFDHADLFPRNVFVPRAPAPTSTPP